MTLWYHCSWPTVPQLTIDQGALMQDGAICCKLNTCVCVCTCVYECVCMRTRIYDCVLHDCAYAWTHHMHIHRHPHPPSLSPPPHPHPHSHPTPPPTQHTRQVWFHRTMFVTIGGYLWWLIGADVSSLHVITCYASTQGVEPSVTVGTLQFCSLCVECLVCVECIACV